MMSVFLLRLGFQQNVLELCGGRWGSGLAGTGDNPSNRKIVPLRLFVDDLQHFQGIVGGVDLPFVSVFHEAVPRTDQ